MPQHDGPGQHQRPGQRHQERQRPRRGAPVERRARAGRRRARRRPRSRPRTTPQACRPAGPRESETRPTTPPSSPSTVAGPTTGATTRLATTATRLTWPEMRRHQRRAGQLRRRRHRDGLREPPWQPPGHRVPPRRRDEQDPRGRQHRQREARRGRQPGIDEQQPDDGRAETAYAAVPATPSQADQRDGAHRGRSQHAGLGASQQHEADDPGRADDAEPPATDADPAGHDEQEADDQGQVGARDGRQVGEPGGAEVLDQPRRHSRVVAVDQGGHQCPLARGPMGHGVADRGAQRLGRPPAVTGRRHALGWTARRHGGREVTGVLDRRQSTGEADPLPHRQPLPVVAAEHQHGLVSPDRDPHQHPVTEPPGDPPRVGGDRAGQRHQGALLGGQRDGTLAHGLRAGERHRADAGRHRHHGQRGEGQPPTMRHHRQEQGHGHQAQRAGHDGQRPAHRECSRPRRQAEQRHAQVGARHSVT